MKHLRHLGQENAAFLSHYLFLGYSFRVESLFPRDRLKQGAGACANSLFKHESGGAAKLQAGNSPCPADGTSAMPKHS